MMATKPRDPAIVSRTMSRIRSKDTKPEVVLRKALWSLGLRYRKHYDRIFGKPDIAFPGCRVAVFCDGDFWHGKNWDTRKSRLVQNREYWVSKIERNMARDVQVNTQLHDAGWKVIRIWESDIHADPFGCAHAVASVVRGRQKS